MVEVQAGAGPDLERSPTRLSEEFGTHVAEAGLLVGGEHAVVDRGDDRVPG